jgi:aromatic ring-opening dioxygenase LigB subunit
MGGQRLVSVHMSTDLAHLRDRHGGYGYISSWGSASVALNLLESALAG